MGKVWVDFGVCQHSALQAERNEKAKLVGSRSGRYAQRVVGVPLVLVSAVKRSLRRWTCKGVEVRLL